LLSTDAHGLLAREADSVLIDVRTQAEWAWVGVPDLGPLGKTPLYLEWQSFPSMQVDRQFATRLAAMLESAGVKRGASLIFLCRSGARSRHTAIAMTSAGWAPCFNVSDGFEGPLDSSRHRSVVAGWKAAGLPWTQP
jgi:rhodanese-related sulfurtransferase